MKIKGVIEDLKIKKRKKKNGRKNSKNISRTFSGVVGSVGSVHFHSSLVRLIFLKIYRPLPM